MSGTIINLIIQIIAGAIGGNAAAAGVDKADLVQPEIPFPAPLEVLAAAKFSARSFLHLRRPPVVPTLSQSWAN